MLRSSIQTHRNRNKQSRRETPQGKRGGGKSSKNRYKKSKWFCGWGIAGIRKNYGIRRIASIADNVSGRIQTLTSIAVSVLGRIQYRGQCIR